MGVINPHELKKNMHHVFSFYNMKFLYKKHEHKHEVFIVFNVIYC